MKLVVCGSEGKLGGAIVGQLSLNSHRLAAGLDCKDGRVPSPQEVRLALEKGDGVIIAVNSPDTALHQAELCVELGKPVAIGTTAFTSPQLKKLAKLAKEGLVLQASNFSPSVLGFIWQMKQEAAKYTDEAVVIEEIHHEGKKDYPSGTALKLAKAICAVRGWNCEECILCILVPEGEPDPPEPRDQIVQIISRRKDTEVATHRVTFKNGAGAITFTSEICGRDDFARGAIQALLWLCKQEPGRLYDMEDVLGF